MEIRIIISNQKSRKVPVRRKMSLYANSPTGLRDHVGQCDGCKGSCPKMVIDSNGHVRGRCGAYFGSLECIIKY